MNRALLRLRKNKGNDNKNNDATVTKSNKILDMAQQLNNVFKPGMSSENKNQEINYNIEKKNENNGDIKENNEIINQNVFCTDVARTNNDLVDIIDNKPFKAVTKKKGKKIDFNSV